MEYQYRVDVPPALLREALCAAQSAIGLDFYEELATRFNRILGKLINECDRMRPLGPDGKHGDLHTPECGCQDKGHYQPSMNQRFGPRST